MESRAATERINRKWDILCEKTWLMTSLYRRLTCIWLLLNTFLDKFLVADSNRGIFVMLCGQSFRLNVSFMGNKFIFEERKNEERILRQALTKIWYECGGYWSGNMSKYKIFEKFTLFCPKMKKMMISCNLFKYLKFVTSLCLNRMDDFLSGSPVRSNDSLTGTESFISLSVMTKKIW